MTAFTMATGIFVIATGLLLAQAKAAECSLTKTTLTQRCGHVFTTNDETRICPFDQSKCVVMAAGECFSNDGMTAYQENGLKCPYDKTKCVLATKSTYEEKFSKVDEDNRNEFDFSSEAKSLREVGKFCYNASGIDTGHVVLVRSERYCVYQPMQCNAMPFDDSIKSVQVLYDIDHSKENIAMTLNISELGPNFAYDAFNVSTKVKTLTLKSNQLTSISQTTFPDNLVFIDISNNKLTTIGSLDKIAPNLEQFLAIGNAITSLESSSFPPSLFQLSLQNNQIQELNISALPDALVSLFLNENGLSKIHGSFGAAMTYLSLADNRLTTFDGSILNQKQTSLTLFLQNNKITELSGRFPPTLKSLNLYGNKLQHFPSILQDSTISSLNIGLNSFTWSGTSKFAKNLTELNMTSTPIDGGVLDVSKLPSTLISLDISNCKINQILGEFPTSIKVLRMDRNPMGMWVASNQMLGFLRNLKELSLPDMPTNFTCPTSAIKQVKDNYNVCNQETSDNPTPLPTIADTKNNGLGLYFVIAGGAIVVLLMVFGYVWYRKRIARLDMNLSLLETSKALKLEYYPNNEIPQTAETEDSIERISLGDDLIQYRIPLNEVDIIKPLSFGRAKSDITNDTPIQPQNAFSKDKVMLYKAKFNDQFVVLKTLTTDGNAISAEAEQFVQSIRLRSTLDHPNIVGFLGVVWSTNVKKGIVGYGVLMEYLSHGDLARLLAFDSAKTPNERLLQWRPRTSEHRSKLGILMDIASAIVYLHSFSPPLVHRNIQSKNIFLGDPSSAKLSGLKASPTFEPSELITAPEVLKGEPWTEKADVYAFGILLCELDLGHHPYVNSTNSDSNRQIATLVVADLLQPSFSADCPMEVQDIGRKCLAFDRKDRPTAVQMEFWLRKAKAAVHGDL